jgi:hypothetical protein
MSTTNTTTQTINFYDAKKIIENKMSDLRLELRGQEHEQAILKLRELDNELKELKINKIIDDINREQQNKRECARIAYEVEHAPESVINNDGSFHATKVKKYPKLAALKYATATYQNGLMYQINIGRERFTMYKTLYKHGEETKYILPVDFNDFLKLNGIMQEPLTRKEYNRINSELEKANNEMDQAIKKYEEARAALNISQFQNWGMIEQSNKHLYIYNVKRY